MPTPMSPGPQRSPTEISLAQLAHIPSHEDVGEGTSRSATQGFDDSHFQQNTTGLGLATHESEDFSAPPPEYTSPEGSVDRGRRNSGDSEGEEISDDEGRSLLPSEDTRPPIPTYDAAVANSPPRGRG